MDKGAMNAIGARAEDAAAEHLRRAGLRLLNRNWRCRHGEIDLIADDDGTLVFAEVRLRRGAGLFGGARESITAAKRHRLLAAARLYLALLRREADCRFDVLLIDAQSEGRIEWIRDAFGE
jgi:putative endonuclease